MNATAKRLGLKESHFVNPNGLHDAAHVSSARDMAMIGRALFKDFPEHADLWGIGALQLGDEIIENHNGLLGRYPGADGMKTGFVCASGFNVVASATRNGRRLIAVVLGYPSARERTIEAARLFDRGFGQWVGGEGPLESLPASSVLTAPDIRADICSRRNRAAVLAAEEEEAAPAAAPSGGRGQARVAVAAVAAESGAQMTAEMATQPVHFDPVPVFVGPKPGWTGPVLAARPPEKAPPVASAYAADKPSALQGAAPESAPIALQSAVRPLKLAKPAKAVKAAKTAAHAKQLAAAKKKDQRAPAAPVH
jgi:D-alanyl-D-alanine carboxypeptidase